MYVPIPHLHHISNAVNFGRNGMTVFLNISQMSDMHWRVTSYIYSAVFLYITFMTRHVKYTVVFIDDGSFLFPVKSYRNHYRGT